MFVAVCTQHVEADGSLENASVNSPAYHFTYKTFIDLSSVLLRNQSLSSNSSGFEKALQQYPCQNNQVDMVDLYCLQECFDLPKFFSTKMHNFKEQILKIPGMYVLGSLCPGGLHGIDLS